MPKFAGMWLPVLVYLIARQEFFLKKAFDWGCSSCYIDSKPVAIRHFLSSVEGPYRFPGIDSFLRNNKSSAFLSRIK